SLGSRRAPPSQRMHSRRREKVCRLSAELGGQRFGRSRASFPVRRSPQKLRKAIKFAMSEPAKNPFDVLLDAFLQVVREEIAAANGNGHAAIELFTPEQLAERMKVPVSWVYEQSRHG